VSKVLAAGLCAALLWFAAAARAVEPAAPIIIHAGKTDSINHGLAMQFAEALAEGNNALTIQVEDSQGSVQNIKDAPRLGGNYVFTAPPDLIAQAKRGDKPFERDAHYHEIRALFPIPAQTMHWVVRAETDVHRFADLAGQPFVPGAKGSFGERQTASALHVLGLDSQVQLIDIDAAGAKAALTGKQVAGAAFAGTVPVASVAELAGALPIRLLSLDRAELAKVLAADDSLVFQTIPAGTYAGVAEPVSTVALPAGAYATTQMSEATAYAITKAFWTQKQVLGERNAPWNSVTPANLARLGVKLHKGAERYYREAKIKIPSTVR
jgi:uncharacterized protein